MQGLVYKPKVLQYTRRPTAWQDRTQKSFAATKVVQVKGNQGNKQPVQGVLSVPVDAISIPEELLSTDESDSSQDLKPLPRPVPITTYNLQQSSISSADILPQLSGYKPSLSPITTNQFQVNPVTSSDTIPSTNDSIPIESVIDRQPIYNLPTTSVTSWHVVTPSSLTPC